MDPKIIGHFALDLKMFSDGNIWRSVRWLVAVAVSNDGGATGPHTPAQYHITYQ